jgi:hypothetical protein
VDSESEHSSAESHHEGDIPGVDGPIASEKESSGSSAHGKTQSGAPEKKSWKSLPWKKILLGSTTVLLLGTLGVSVRLLLLGKKGESSHASSTHDTSHGAEHADSSSHGPGKHAATEHAATEHAATEHAATEHAATEHAATEHAATEHAATEHAATEHAATEHAATEHAAETASDAHSSLASSHLYGESSVPAWMAPVVRPLETALNRIEGKAEVIRDALEENRKLRLENANLRVQAESLRLDCRVQEAKAQNQLNEQILEHETGQKMGRTLASIAYRPPRHLDPAQLHTLGLTYMKAKEFEKSAVIFSLLTQMNDQAGGQVDALKKHPLSRIRLLAGVAWYKLDHIELADQYFGEVLDLPETEKDMPFQAQARLWRALSAKRLGKNTKSQFWLREIVDRHPASAESSWVNRPKEGQSTSNREEGPHEAGHSTQH